MKALDLSPISLGDTASWNERLGAFTVKVHGNRDFAALVILRNAPLPMAHLESGEHDKQTKLGPQLHDRLEQEVNAAIARGAHHVSEGVAMLTPEELAKL